MPPADVRRGDGGQISDFLEQMCRQVKDTVAGRSGDALVVRKWQRTLLGQLFARRPDSRRRHRVGLIGLPRKNGKSALGSGIALHGLYLGPDGAEVYSCAAEKDQARIVFGVAKRIVELEPELLGLAKLYKDAIEIPSTGSVYRVLSAEAYSKEGLSPTLVVFDEVHAQPNRDLWDVMNLGSGARYDPLVLGITTAGVRADSTGGDSVCYQLYQHGRRIASGETVDPSFFMAWWESDGDHTDPKVWNAANPGIGDLVDREDFESVVRKTPEPEFRTKRLNQWVNSAESWLPTGAFEALKGSKPAGDVVLGFDGAYSGDSTALVGCTVGPKPHLFVVDAWEKPLGDDSWRVEISVVEEAIRQACRNHRVREVVCDPYRWQRSIQILLDEGFPMVEYPTSSPARMVPACATFYDAVMDSQLSHDNDPRLIRHLQNATVKRDRFGARIVKDAKESPRKIDLAVCAIIAHERAVLLRDAVTFEPLVVWR